MARNDKRTVFGIHSLTLYRRSDRLPYGQLDVLDGANFSLSGEIITLNGGSSRYAWDAADGLITAELAFTPKEYPDFLYEVLLGKQPTANTSETTGDTSTLTNQQGTSIVATTGIAAVGAVSGSEEDMKFAKYIVKAASATTVDVYAMSDVDFARGTDKVFEDDSLKITAAPLTITTSTPVTVPGYGIELTGDSGTIAMVTDDTAVFDVRPINERNSVVTIGGISDEYPEFGAIAVAEKQGSGEMVEIDIFRMKAIGLPHNLTAKEWSVAEITAQAYQDTARGGVASFRMIDEF